MVGAGASGSQIARELSDSRKVYLAGRDTGSLPRKILGLDVYWWLYKTGLLTIRWDSWLGRRMGKNADKGDVHVGAKLKPMARKAGIIRMCKLTGMDQNELVFADGKRVSDIQSIVWATGYRQSFDWVHFPIFEKNGLPRHQRGVVQEAPGLYFIGLKTLYRVNSSLMAPDVGASGHFARATLTFLGTAQGPDFFTIYGGNDFGCRFLVGTLFAPQDRNYRP